MKAERLLINDAAAKFFWRRTLRLAPAYYVVLFVAACMMPRVREALPWLALYASNMLTAWSGVNAPLLPTWSLAVEEQFYVLWFAAVMFLPRRALTSILAGSIAAAIAFRFGYAITGYGKLVFTLPAAVDSLAIGCLMALHPIRVMPRWAACGAAACLLIAAALNGFTDIHAPAQEALWPTLIALAAAWCAWTSQAGFGGVAGRLLGSAPVSYLGRISYGIYPWHMITLYGFHGLPGLWRLTVGGPGWFVAHVALTILIAAASYRYIEQPAMRWRSSATGRVIA